MMMNKIKKYIELSYGRAFIFSINRITHSESIFKELKEKVPWFEVIQLKRKYSYF